MAVESLSDMQSFLNEYPEAQLQIRERLPYNYLISQMILTFQKAILNIQYSAEELREAAEGFVNMIPYAWRDPDFENDLRKAQMEIVEDVRPEFNGTKAKLEWCEDHNIQPIRSTLTFNYFKVFNAVVNLLHRRGMLLKPQYKEIVTGNLAAKHKKQKAERFALADEHDP